ncbi:MAG TPA: FliM/FliN family flagellar motor C-terminal domain-containing protein [Steroidobacteraceae bacterium]|nr:FliM/FliN family flagellar motor C-terminal domain-containing protein [Steroidobacteraceae bacterium]
MSTRSLNDACPILLLGDSRRDELLRNLQATANAWGKVWSAQEFDISAESTESARQRCPGWVAEDRGSTLLQVESSAEFVASLIGRQAAFSSGTLARSVIEELEQKVFQSLCDHVLRAAKLESVVIHRAELARSYRRQTHWIRIATRGTRANLLVGLDGRVVERLVSRQVIEAKADKLVARRSSISEARMSLEAVLGTAEVSVAELAELNEGDVIVLSNRLSEPVDLVNEAGQFVARARLGSSGTNRAVSVTAVVDRK